MGAHGPPTVLSPEIVPWINEPSSSQLAPASSATPSNTDQQDPPKSAAEPLATPPATPTSAPATSSSAPSAAPSGTSPSILEYSQNHSSNTNRKAIIAGSVVGALVVLGIALLILIMLRRKKNLAKERQEANCPPPYTDPDMSAYLSGGPTSVDTDEKVDLRNGVDHNPSVQQLDSTMVSELGDGPLGSIPELPERGFSHMKPVYPPHVASPALASKRSNRLSGVTEREQVVDAEHAMSWAEFQHNINCAEQGNAASRLSQPHNSPDATVAVWENMSPSRAVPSEANGADT